MPTVLVCYDISRDDNRARAAATLQMWGDRVQRSVFVCTMDTRQLAELTTQVRSIIDAHTDAVHLMPLCGACCSGITVLGQATTDPDQLYRAIA